MGDKLFEPVFRGLKNYRHSPEIEWLAVLLPSLAKLFVSAAFIVIYMFAGELFPTVIRGLAIGIASTASQLGLVVTPYIIFLVSDLSHISARIPEEKLSASLQLVPSLNFIQKFIFRGRFMESLSRSSFLASCRDWPCYWCWVCQKLSTLPFPRPCRMLRTMKITEKEWKKCENSSLRLKEQKRTSDATHSGGQKSVSFPIASNTENCRGLPPIPRYVFHVL